MSKTILTEVKGFTPVIDSIVEDVGLMPALIFGRVWRYCQMEDQVCSASLGRIGSEIGVSAKTVQRHIKTLCKAGYLIDRTPDRRNRPHHYADAGKVEVRGILSALDRLDRESYQDESRSDRESYRSDRESYPGRTESPLKIEEDTKEDSTHSDPKANFAMLARVCKIDLETITPKQRGMLNQVEKILRDKKGVTADDIKAFGLWWYKHWWQGKDGQPPRPTQVRESWGIFEQRDNAERSDGHLRIKI